MLVAITQQNYDFMKYSKRHEGGTMIIKANGYELEFLDNLDVYLGIPNKGQTFTKRDKLDKRTISQLAEIQKKAEELIRTTERLLG